MGIVVDEVAVNVQGGDDQGATGDAAGGAGNGSGGEPHDPDPHVQVARLSFEIGRRERRRDRLVAD